jgi:hypothetical protein
MRAKVVISKDGVWAGEGYWQSDHIVDCPAVLPDEVYSAIEKAILTGFKAVKEEGERWPRDYAQGGKITVNGHYYDWWYYPNYR